MFPAWNSKIDAKLPDDSPLRGKAAIANAKVAYDEFQKVFSSRRWENLKVKGARVQRPLWASTSTKNPSYPDTIYVDNLIGPETVNTVPPQTLVAYKDHGVAEVTITRDLEEAQNNLEKLREAGISMEQMTQELEEEGVKAFADAFSQLLETIEKRRASTQVIHHALHAIVVATAQEIQRVVCRGGIILISVPARREVAMDGEASIEIEPNTFLPTGGSEKGLPHHLFTADEFRSIFP